MNNLSVEELLKPRFQVIADFPRNCAHIGRIFEPGEIGIETQIKWEQYPHLFKKLEWWEERKESDMPQFVKKGERVYDVAEADEKYCDRFMFDHPMTEHWVQYYDCLPATAEEYNNQKIKNHE